MDGFLTVGGIVSCVAGGFFHLLALQKSKKAYQLEHHVLSLDGRGRDGIQTVLDVLPLMVALTGTIFCRKPVSCSLSDRECAIVERVEEKKVESLVNNVWVGGYEHISLDRREQVFGVLVDDVVLPVVRPLSLEGKYLQKTGEQFEPNPNERSLVHQVVGQVSGHRDLGIRTTERCLPVGTVVTAVGELAWETVDSTSLDSDQATLMRNPKGLSSTALVIRRPSGKNKDKNHFMLWEGAAFGEIIDMYRGAASFASTASTYCFIVGASMIGTTLFRMLHRKYRERAFLKKFRQNLRDKRRNTRRTHDEGEEQQHDEDEEEDSEETGHVCVVCMDAPSSKAYPCGHLCICSSCSTRGSVSTACPICRTRGKPIVIYSV